MSQFFTPHKEQIFQGQGITNKNKSARDGDWICLNCNNLNYSFRKKCNRCKTQTRELNEQLQAYYYDYIPQFYIDEKENFPSLSSAPSIYYPSQKTELKKAGKSQCQIHWNKLELTPQKLVQKRQLPSVSPLVKRYNRHENNSTQESKNRGLFQDQAIWANINIKYLDDSQFLSPNKQIEENNYEIYEIQKTIQKIML